MTVPTDDDEKICVILTGGNKKAPGLDLRPISLYHFFSLRFSGTITISLRFSGTINYYQLLVAVSLHELCETNFQLQMTRRQIPKRILN